MGATEVVNALAEVVTALQAHAGEPAAIVCAVEALAALKHISSGDPSNIDLILAAGGVQLVRAAQNVVKGHGSTGQHSLSLLTQIACHPATPSEDALAAGIAVLDMGDLAGSANGMPGVLWGLSFLVPALMARTDLEPSALRDFAYKGADAAINCLHADNAAPWNTPGSLNVVEILTTVLGVLWGITQWCDSIDDQEIRDNVVKATAMGAKSLLDVFRARKGMDMLDVTMAGKAAAGLIYALATLALLGAPILPLKDLKLAFTTAVGVISLNRRSAMVGNDSSSAEWDETLISWAPLATALMLTIESLRKSGPDVLNGSDDDSEGRNLVHHLAAHGQARCLAIVLEVVGGSIDFLARTKNGETALQLARMGRYTAVVALLEDVTQRAAEARQAALLEELETAEIISSADDAARKAKKKKNIIRAPSFASDQPDEKTQKVALSSDIDDGSMSPQAAAEQARAELRQRLEDEYEHALELRRIELAQQSASGITFRSDPLSAINTLVSPTSNGEEEESSLVFTPAESQSPADRPSTPGNLLETVIGDGGSSGGSGSGLDEDPFMRLDSDGGGSMDVLSAPGSINGPLRREHSLFGSPSLTGDLFGGAGSSLGSLGPSSPSLTATISSFSRMMTHENTPTLPDALFVHHGPIGLPDQQHNANATSPGGRGGGVGNPLPSASLLASLRPNSNSMHHSFSQPHLVSPMASFLGNITPLRQSSTIHSSLGSPTGDVLGSSSSDGDSDASLEPTRHLWIGNLGTRTPRAVLKAVFEAHGVIEDVVTFPGRMYAFVNYTSVEEATAASEALQNQVVSELTGDRPLLLKYRPVKKAAMHLRALGDVGIDGLDGTAGGLGLSRGDPDGNCTDPSPRIWLGNIAPTATSKTLQAVLGRFGPLSDAAVFPARIGPLGYAFVKFEVLEDAVRALETLNNTVVPPLSGSKQLKMRYKPAASGTTGRDDAAESAKATTAPTRHLWLGNITQKPSEDVVYQLFAKYGRVDSARVFPAKAYAFVNYADLNAAARAMSELDGVPIPALTGVKPLVMRFQQESQQPARPGATGVAGLSNIGAALAAMPRTHSESALTLAASLNQLVPGAGGMGLNGLGSLAYRSDSLASEDALGAVSSAMGGGPGSNGGWAPRPVHRSASLSLLSSATMSGMHGLHSHPSAKRSSPPMTSPFAPMMGMGMADHANPHVNMTHHMSHQGTTTSASQLSAVLNNLAALQRAASNSSAASNAQHDSIANLSHYFASQTLNPPEPAMSAAPTMSQNSWSVGLDSLLCPLSNQLMTDPVMAADGVTYNRPAILEWLATQ